jgi:hypothetical protein
MSQPFDSRVNRVLAFFTRNPEEELTTLDIVLKFEIQQNHVSGTLRRAVDEHMLNCSNSGPGRGKLSIYTAGHALLLMNGERRILEERRAKDRGDEDRRKDAFSHEHAVMACVSVQMCVPVGGG